MIIFDLDGTLADCEHRRHFVDPKKNPNIVEGWTSKRNGLHYYDKHSLKKWKPDWKSFYEACDKDELIIPATTLFNFMNGNYEIQIWSGRCESVREKTEKWLDKHEITCSKLKMRPLGDNTPDDVLKERWLDEFLNDKYPGTSFGPNPIDFVFDDRKKVVRMWRRRGIFVFNCCQHDEEF